MDIHGGTTETDILEAFDRVEIRAKASGKAFIFLDEMNACNHTGNVVSRFPPIRNNCFDSFFKPSALIEEAILHSSLNGSPLAEGVQTVVVLAAANPYRKRLPKVRPGTR